MPDLSLIIVNYGNAGLTRECIKNFNGHTLTNASIEIIVVDNSNDAALAETLATRYPGVLYLPVQTNTGFARGNNIGIAQARGRFIGIVNYDITPLPGALDALVAYMDAHLDVGIAAPQLHNPDESVQQSYYRFHTLMTPLYRRLILGRLPLGKKHLDSFLMQDVSMTEPRDIDWALGAFLLIRKTALEEVGVFDERFFLYFEDTDLCRRFWAKGWRVRYLPHVHMLHLHLRDSAHTMGLWALRNKATRIHLYSACKYFIKQWSGKYKSEARNRITHIV